MWDSSQTPNQARICPYAAGLKSLLSSPHGEARRRWEVMEINQKAEQTSFMFFLFVFCVLMISFGFVESHIAQDSLKLAILLQLS